MKKSLLFGMMLLAASSMFAEEANVVQIGSFSDRSWGANNFPMWSYWECSESEFLYTADDLKALPAGTIQKIEYAAYGGDADFATGFSIWFENTNDISTGGEDGKQFKSTDDMTLVYKDEKKTSTKFPEDVLNGSLDTPGYLGFELAEPFQYTGGGLRIHFTSESFWYNNNELNFVQDDNKIWEGEELNSVLRKAGGNWSLPAVSNPGRMFPIVKFTMATSTGIEGPTVEEVKNVTYYNIYGQKVDADAKGLVISSEGKKFFRN